jgi:RNA polymerase sigma-70 factor (ECF subfamily)
MITMTSIDTLYNKFRPKLLSIAYSFGYDIDSAKDLVQQFFLELIQKKLPTDIRNPEAFFIIAFKRKIIDQHRANKKKAIPIDSELIVSVPSAQEVLEKLEDNQALINRLEEAYKKLPSRCRKAIYLKYYKGYTTKEIAQITGLSEQNIYNNLSKGIQQLRQSLSKHANKAKFAALVILIVLCSFIF